MIETLRIQDFAIVESEQLEFGPGLNVLTGETGAGKSIVLGALGLLAGARSSPQRVRDRCETATVEAVFRTEHTAGLEAELEERGFEVDEHELVVARTVSRNGRSRARLAGQLVPAAVLAEVFGGRIEISSQHDSQALLRPEWQGLVLDRAAALLTLREAVATGYARLRALDDELGQLRAAENDRERRRDFLSFQRAEIDDAQLDVDEIEDLRADRSRLAHAEKLREEGAAALALLCGDLAGNEAPNAADLLSQSARRLGALEGLDPKLSSLVSRVSSAQEEVRDAAAELERYTAGIEADPGRLAAMDERLARVETLQRKYGGSVAEVLRVRDELASELELIEGASGRAEAIERERAECAAGLAADAEALSKGRAEAAVRLGRAVQRALRELAMPRSRFSAALIPSTAPAGAPCGPGGREFVEFRFCADSEGELRPLSAVASGGELSRTFLAVKSAIREADAGMVLVFDEVDAGIGGPTADRVGRSLADLAGRHQVLCITHLPQIAAYATTHFQVQKRDHGAGARARIVRVEGAQRIEEIARMAGGEEVGEATRRHARDLLRARSTL